ncbi:N-acetyltransferase [Ancylomarina euxinus]|uniref:N-acetyltransferase n=1 Tax=Ancylomarina euxinus TaxID=2283627 RepID=A0A425Y1U0_9BACT|nr:GNAT family N-acetyltransferase [Ancylomarina euxinus]MCZ4695175.1 GNAT family N-acetyltransferase [Ancylomarina euxinus]MUP14891.1 GNAT family N-acetyltransferase [Ancylomarina euxinus]RRG21786.1 N-acetyltransferase [Ancylomarina euxinus]
MNIRLAQHTDLKSINTIYNQAVAARYCTADLDPISISEREKWFDTHSEDKYPVYVGLENDVVVAWFSFSAWRLGRRALEMSAEVSYYIHDKHFRKGYAKQLMNFAIEKAPELGFINLFAILLEPNTASIKLLEKFDFQLWGRLPDIANIDGEVCSQRIYGRKV